MAETEPPRRGEVWLADLGPTRGHEQAGRRPVLIISDDIFNRGPADLVEVLERRSSLLIEAGHVRIDGRELPVYEFRHLTFQEYLAGLALVDGRFPGHEKGVRLAGRVAPLAGVVREQDTRFGSPESVVTANWREPLRLCLAACPRLGRHHAGRLGTLP